MKILFAFLDIISFGARYKCTVVECGFAWKTVLSLSGIVY
jgi:hypothetical protein